MPSTCPNLGPTLPAEIRGNSNHMTRLLFFLLSASAFGAGSLVPRNDTPPMPLRDYRASVVIHDTVAVTQVLHTFENQTDADGAAEFLFRFPAGVEPSEPEVRVAGKPWAGKVLTADAALALVHEIGHPHMWGDLDGRLLHLRIPKVPTGAVTVELRYGQELANRGSFLAYEHPVSLSDRALQDVERIHFEAELRTTDPLKSVFSPSHPLNILRRTNHEAALHISHGWQRNILLLCSQGRDAVTLDLLTEPEANSDGGWFLLNITPQLRHPQEAIVRQDVVFVLDISSSMAGEPLRQLKRGFDACLNRLHPQDRFNVILFGTEVHKLSEKLVGREQKRAALEFVASAEAQGGTAISEALLPALGMQTAAARPFHVVLVTDGQPTVGQTRVPPILKAVQNAQVGETAPRIWPLGIGVDANTRLLDHTAHLTDGATEYALPHENIADAMARLWMRLCTPVLSHVELTTAGVQLYDVHPRFIPNLCPGESFTMFGRYRGGSKGVLYLQGLVNGQAKQWQATHQFHAEDGADPRHYISHLWGARKIGTLLEYTRLYGERADVRQKISRLADQEDAQTPLETQQVYQVAVPQTNPSVSRGHRHDYLLRPSRGISTLAAPPAPLAELTGLYLSDLPHLLTPDARSFEVAAFPFEVSALQVDTGLRGLEVSRAIRSLRERTVAAP